MMTFVRLCLLVCIPTCAFGLGSNQLYTGDAWTVPAGKTQALMFTDHTRPVRTRLGGFALRHGLSSNADAKLAYSYLWNASGPNAEFGPNVGLKYRIAGNGLTNPSLAASLQYAASPRTGGRSHKSDYGATLIGSYPTPFAEILANFGRAFIGDDVPDLRLVSFAVVRPVASHALVAAEYSSIQRLGPGGPPVPRHQIAAAVVYGSRLGWSYSVEVGYLPDGERVKWHTTLGVGTVF